MNFIKQLIRALILVLILLVLTIIVQMLNGAEINVVKIKRWLISNLFFGLPFYFANGYLNSGLNKLYTWWEQPKKRVLIGVPAFMIMNATLMILLIYFFSVWILKVDEPSLFDRRNLFSIIMAMTICLIVTLYFHAVGFFKGYVSQLKVSEKLREEKEVAEINALKSQVNPHFLFNSFNVLSGLIDENPAKAQEFLKGLSKIYRYILENRNEDLSTVSEELSFAKQYFKLQQTRFENSIQIEVIVPEEAMGKKLPALSLQLLLENAIKHNRFDKETPLNILISHQANSLSVKNNKRERRNLNGSNGVGLSNIKQRYKLHLIDGFEVDDKQDSFTVRLPLI